MKKYALHVVLALTMFASVAASTATPTIDFTLSSANNGADTQVSWVFGNDWLSGSSVTSNGALWGIGIGSYSSFINNSFLADGSSVTFTVQNAGAITNLTTGTTYQITSVIFQSGGGMDVVSLVFDNGGNVMSHTGDQISYTPGTDSYTVSLGFGNLVTGTYTMDNTITSPATAETLTIVPEPSTYALLVVTGAGLFCLKRRKA